MSGAAPRASGDHAPYSAMPAHVRAWVDETLGSPVVAVAEQVGGMSPGCATRLTCADGTRAFVKAVGVELNPDSPNIFRREVTALTLLGSHPLWADLLASYDEADWVALLLEDVEGHHPDLADEATMDRLLDATDELAGVVRERVPELPAPDPDRGGLNDLGNFSRWAGAFDHAADVPAGLMPRWVVERAADLKRQVLDLGNHCADSLVHWDIRNDNLLVRPSGEVVFVDWGQCGVGADWLDPLLARLERVDTPWFDASLAILARAGAGG